MNLSSVVGISVRQDQPPSALRLKEIIFPEIFGFPCKVQVIALVTAPLVAVNAVIPYALQAFDEAAVKPTSLKAAGIAPSFTAFS